ncbi:MAG: aminotransferase class III-fold pyridoxal phosphate-dependent enzyme [Clostridiales bacterium]|nr:aminotransferase class III-fold pyridoxal phosphate-dependent enzyme [Clostridiales bacterium]
MDRGHIKELDAKYIVHTYNRYDVVVDHACGALVTDVNGKEYVDLCSGYAANSLGYQDEAWLEAVIGQLKKVQHTSNLYYSEPGPLVAEKLVKRSGLCKVWFANSGGEANEAAIKTARKYGNTLADHKKNTIISLKKSFHGRTLATVTATGLAEAQEVFAPLVPGFVHAEIDDPEELVKLADQYDPCAFLMELVQGEGGVHALDRAFVDKAVELCDSRDILFIDDEVQVGIGRSGTLFAFEQYGFKPDIVSFAKGIGAGLPIGGIICGPKTCDVLVPGDHGSTFGMNPVACAGACVVLDTMDEKFLASVNEKAALIRGELKKMKKVTGLDGLGLMIGIDLKDMTGAEAVSRLMEEGVLAIPAGSRLRLLPPLTISEDEIERALKAIRKVLD